MNGQIQDRTALGQRRQNDRGRQPGNKRRRDEAASQPGGEYTIASVFLVMPGRCTLPLDRKHRLDRALAGTQRYYNSVRALGRHETGRNGDPNRERTQQQQGEKALSCP